MNLVQFLGWLQESPPILLLRGANHLVIEITEVAHVMGLVAFLAALLLVDLRLLGLGLTRQAVAEVARAAAPLFRGGLALTLATGTILFLSGPVRYVENAAFPPKMAVLLAALLVQLLVVGRVARLPAPSSALARSAGAASLLLWFGVGLCGRAIGYV